MNDKIWQKITLTLLTAAFTYSAPVHSAYYDYAPPDNHYQLMNLPSNNFVALNQGMDSPAMGFAVVNNQEGEPVCYGLPESMIRKIGSFEGDETYEKFGGAYRLGLEFAAGRFIAIDENYGGVTLFAVPEAPGSTNMLIDIKAFKLERLNWAGSVGVGMRHIDKSTHKVFGVNIYYDYLDQRGSFNQWGLGFELFSKCWEFHLNGYLPTGRLHRQLSERVKIFAGGFEGIFRENEFALRGVEFTAGGRWNFIDKLNLYVASGLYMYNNKDVGNIQGVQCNTELNWNEWISFKLNASYDSKFRGRVQGIIAVSFPLNFGCCRDTCDVCPCYTCDLLARPVRRNDLIFLRRCCSVERNWDDCGLPIQ